MKYLFYAVLQKEGEYYNVVFPDLPGVVTFGNDIKEAVEMAYDALYGHLLIMAEDNDKIPKPSSYFELTKDLKENEHIQLITVGTPLIWFKLKNELIYFLLNKNESVNYF